MVVIRYKKSSIIKGYSYDNLGLEVVIEVVMSS